MNVMKKSLALLLVFVLALSCLPLGAVTAFAAENEETQPPTEAPETVPEEEAETRPDDTEEAPTEATTPETESVEEAPPEEEISGASAGIRPGSFLSASWGCNSIRSGE